MMQKNHLYAAALAAVFIGAAGLAIAEKADVKENDARAVSHLAVSLTQAIAAAEQSANGKAARAEYESGKKGTYYQVEVVSGAKVFDVRVDTASGKVLSSAEDKVDQGDKEDDD